MMELNVLWFVLITVLFTGFFFLEGFDYGVGILMPFVGRKDQERSQVIQTIGPVWDGNEVWMITAGGALFAAFPHVYATMFSAFYLALFLMLVALILRGVAFELRSKEATHRWRKGWEWAIWLGSALPAFLWGVAVTNLIGGIPILDSMIYGGGFWDLITPYTIVGGLTFFTVFTFHGAAFLTKRLADPGLIARARLCALRAGAAAVFFFILCYVMTISKTILIYNLSAVLLLSGAGLIFILAIIYMVFQRYTGSFICGGLAIICTSVGFFTGLFPCLMVSSLNPLWSLTIENAASTPYTLSIMTMAAAVMVPIVLIYQAWSYWIFRKRVTPQDVKSH